MTDQSNQKEVPPVLDAQGLLPVGIHTVTMPQVREMFGRFQTTDRRLKLCEKLERFVDEVRRSGIATEVRIDGSFVMRGVDEPDDIDVILVMRPDWDMSADIRPFEYNLVAKKRTKKEYEIEVYAVTHDLVDDADGMSVFFQQVNTKWIQKYNWTPGLCKGILRVVV